MWNRGWRSDLWSRLDQQWDLIVVGGGITGAGIFSEAARLGARVLLVEARDFAFGTSSRSTKLVHGGLRYLRQAQVRLTRDSVVERERLLRDAGGLVVPLGFYLTSFKNDGMPTWMFGAGLAVYDLIARKWDHRHHNTRELCERVPSLQGAPLRGGYHYFDAQTDDARLVLRVIREGVLRGGTAANYLEAAELLKDERGVVCGLVLRDRAGEGRTIEVKAHAVVNATGVWADELREKVGGKRKLRAIRGSHIIFTRDKVPIQDAVSLLHPRDGRAVFAVPWEGVILFGTTDVDHGLGLSDEPAISLQETEYLVEAARHAFPTLDLSIKDIRSTFAGVRAVINTGASNPAKESREHAVWEEQGLLTITGGKLTTFRLMALEVLERLGPHVPRLKAVSTASRILDDPSDVLLGSEMDETKRVRLLGRYGAEAGQVISAGSHETIGDSSFLWCELKWAARSEGVVHLDDLLLRRLRVGNLLPEGGLPIMDQIRAAVQLDLGWPEAQWTAEVDRYKTLWTRCYGVPS